MSTEASTEYEKYYVPEKSKLAVCATIGLVLSIYGAASIMNDMTFGDPDVPTNSWTIFLCGLFFFLAFIAALTSSSDTCSSSPSGLMRVAVAGASLSNSRIAPDVWLRARSSRTCPNKTSVVMTAAASK